MGEAAEIDQEGLTLEADMGLFIGIPGIIVLYSFPRLFPQNIQFKNKSTERLTMLMASPCLSPMQLPVPLFPNGLSLC